MSHFLLCQLFSAQSLWSHNYFLSVNVCMFVWDVSVCDCSVCALQITLGIILPNFYLAHSCKTFLGECENHIDTVFTENEKEPN